MWFFNHLAVQGMHEQEFWWHDKMSQGIPYCCTYATCSCSLGYLSVHTTCNSISDGLPTARQAHDIKPMSDQRRCDVMTLIWCCFDVMCLLGGSHVTLLWFWYFFSSSNFFRLELMYRHIIMLLSKPNPNITLRTIAT